VLRLHLDLKQRLSVERSGCILLSNRDNRLKFFIDYRIQKDRKYGRLNNRYIKFD
jgi:hypothetical protein